MNLSLIMVLKFLLDTKMVKRLIKPLCIILPQISWFIKYFKNNKRNIYFLAADDVILKYNKIWKKIKKLLSVEFDSQPVSDVKYVKTKVKAFEKLLQNLQTMKFQKKILIIHYCWNFCWFCNKIRKIKLSWAILSNVNLD